jgi:branched-chain amino acid transport system permease protein
MSVRLAARAAPALFLMLGLVLIALITLTTTDVIARVVTNMFILVTIVTGLYIFVGNSGVFSFGHTSFIALGAYASALLTIPVHLKHVLLPQLPDLLAHAELPTPLAIVAAGVVAAVVAAVVSIPLMRLSGIAASIGTLALLVVVYLVLGNADSITGGSSAIIGIPMDTDLFTALAVAILTIAGAFAYEHSASGLRLRSSREDEYAAQSVGVHIARERAIAFVISAFFVGIGGAVYGHFLGAFNPDAFYVRLTVLSIAMLVVGGVNSLSGAVVGTVTISALTELLRQLEAGVQVGSGTIALPPGFAEVVLAALMLIILVNRPAGITGGRNLEWGFWRGRSLRTGGRRASRQPPDVAAAQPEPVSSTKDVR